MPTKSTRVLPNGRTRVSIMGNVVRRLSLDLDNLVALDLTEIAVDNNCDFFVYRVCRKPLPLINIAVYTSKAMRFIRRAMNLRIGITSTNPPLLVDVIVAIYISKGSPSSNATRNKMITIYIPQNGVIKRVKLFFYLIFLTYLYSVKPIWGSTWKQDKICAQ